MIAIIETGGKQFKVTEGQKVKVPKLDLEEGKAVKFEILLVGDEKAVQVGMPSLKANVTGKVVAHGRSKKVTGIRFKAKKRELTRYGHRQDYTEIEITKVAL
ncbi:MAG: 50S ribosomal protein L21 [Candidatus Moraniibacteriota bacterium]